MGATASTVRASDQVIRVIHGEPSRTRRRKDRFATSPRSYRELIPNANVVELEGIGHYPQVQAPTAVLNAYSEFRERSD